MEKIIEILIDNCNIPERGCVLYENQFEKVAIEIFEALIWHGPDVVPPTGLKVWGDDGQIYYFSCVSSKALPSNGMWIADYGSSQKPKKPKRWRYPEPIKNQ